MMDLHELITAKGYTLIASAMKTSERRLKDIAKGRIALTVDDLYELHKVFGKMFDPDHTILSLGRLREANRCSRKFSPKLKRATWSQNEN
jgi:plasmid maintenance system antidote protein VapI